MIVKEAHAHMLPEVRMPQSSRFLRGMSAETDLTLRLHPNFVLTHRTCVAPGFHFPGGVLLGMDLLHCLPFRLLHWPTSNLLDIDGYHHEITYTSEES